MYLNKLDRVMQLATQLYTLDLSQFGTCLH